MVYVVAVLAAALSQYPSPRTPVPNAPVAALQIAQADGSFPGSLFCEASGSIAAARVPLTLTVEGGRAHFSFAAPSKAGTPSSSSETGGGSVDPNRRIVLTGAVSGRGFTYQSRYVGELSGRGGLLVGSHTGKANGKSFSRRCQMTLGDGRG